MDIEEDIKALQLGSSEDSVLVNVEDGRPDEAIKHEKADGEDIVMAEEQKPDDVEKPDMPEDVSELKDEAHPDLKPKHVEPKGAAGPEDIQVEVEVNKKRHLNVVFIGHVGLVLAIYLFPPSRVWGSFFIKGKLSAQNIILLIQRLIHQLDIQMLSNHLVFHHLYCPKNERSISLEREEKL